MYVRVIRLIAELVAQPADVGVDGPVEDIRLAQAVERVEQLVARQNPAVRLEQRSEQPELGGGERHRLAGDRDVVTVEVHHADRRAGAGAARPTRRRVRRRTAAGHA